MARYALLYEQTLGELRKATAALAKSERDREQYRLFINDCGHLRGYLLWVARREGFDESTIKLLETLPIGNDEQTLREGK
jgi:hypothetical protein